MKETRPAGIKTTTLQINALFIGFGIWLLTLGIIIGVFFTIEDIPHETLLKEMEIDSPVSAMFALAGGGLASLTYTLKRFADMYVANGKNGHEDD